MKNRLALSVAVLCISFLISACGGGSPTSPTPPVANYAGNWTGVYTITGCNQTGGVALANICGSLGTSAPYSFALTQSGSNVAGTFTLGSVAFPSTGGTVGSDGSLALSATTVSNGITIIVNWNLRMSGTAMSGAITQTWSSTTLSGNATVAGTISTATR